MRTTITCGTCSEVIGHLEKDVITPADEQLYRQMTACSNGHIESVMIDEVLVEESITIPEEEL